MWNKVKLGSILVMMCGLPACGKTSTSRKLLEYLSQKAQICILTSLGIRKHHNLFDLENNIQREQVYSLLVDSVGETLKSNYDVIIVDGNFYNRVFRKKIYGLCLNNGYDVYVMHCVVGSEEEIIKRLAFRKKCSYILENKADDIYLFRLIRDSMDSVEEDYYFDGLPVPRIVINTEEQSFSVPNLNKFAKRSRRHLDILKQPFQKFYGFDEKDSINYL